MKRFLNTGIYFLFFLVFLSSNAFLTWINQEISEPPIDRTLEMEYSTLKEEYQKLLQSYELPEITSQKIYSRILFRDPFEFFDIITIQKGSEEGVKQNAAIINEKGLIGIISSVNPHTSQVKLLSNQSTTISVKVQDTYGILNTNPQRECWINNLTKDADITIGESIWTSGLTEIPSNILVGTVEEIQKDHLGLIQTIKVKLAADWNDLSYVTILQKEEVS